MTAITNDVDDDIAAERGAIVGGNSADAYDSIRIFGIHVKHRNRLALGDIGRESGGMFLRRSGGKADQIVDDDLDGAADGVGLEISKVERLRPDALSSEGGVAVHGDRPDFIEDLSRAIHDRPVHSQARLL